MDEAIVYGATAIVALLILGAIGVPVAFSMISVAIAGLWWVGGLDFMASTLKTLPYQAVSDYSFAVIPMFIFMGALAAAAGITTELYEIFQRMFSRVRGGLYMATTVASGMFAAVSGSTVVNAAVFTRLALPEMIKYGYDKGASAGCIAAAGTFAALIPPSISLVVVAILTDASIGQLLIAGIVPGIVTALAYLAGIAVMVRVKPHWAPVQTQHYPLREQIAGLKRLFPTLLLILLVLGGIYSGIMFPSSAGAVGAAGALVIALARRRMSWGGLWDAIKSSAVSTAVLFTIIIGGLLFSRFLTFSGFITDFSSIVSGWDLSVIQLMLVLCVFYLILGMFVDPLSMMLVTIPFVFPVVDNLGVDVIWFAIIVVKLVEIAAITPPLGLNLFAVISASDRAVRSGDLFRGITPFVLIELVVLGILVAYPGISTWLPSQMR